MVDGSGGVEKRSLKIHGGFARRLRVGHTLGWVIRHPAMHVWTVVAAFLTYFCMYGFRKPFTAADFAEPIVGTLGFKELLVIAQVLGYMLSKFVGIKVTAEMPPARRAMAILGLIVASEIALVLFAVTPRPLSAVWLFFNGLPLGMVFGLVIGFLEGRTATEALAAGLCVSFIVADGFVKSVGTWLVKERGVPEGWMPAVAGGLFSIPLLVGVGMLAKVPPPTDRDRDHRNERPPMTRADRRALLKKYGMGLTLIVVAYIVVTVLRSYRADFGPQLWEGLLGTKAAPEAFTYSELWVAFGVLIVSGATVLIRSNRTAFLTSLYVSLMGFAILAATLLARQWDRIGPVGFMVGVGLGLYLPYVAVHTTVFERFLAATREKGNLGFLMSFADAFGYLGYVAVMIVRNIASPGERVLDYFDAMAWFTVAVGFVLVGAAIVSFQRRLPADEASS